MNIQKTRTLLPYSHENVTKVNAPLHQVNSYKMPPKVDVKTLAGKMENAVKILYELVEEFEVIFSLKPELKTLEAAFNQVETKYRLIKKQQETILDRLVDESPETKN